MRCPKCDNRFIKSGKDADVLYLKRLVLNKSTGEVMIACHNCKALIKPTTDFLKSVRGIFFEKTK